MVNLFWIYNRYMQAVGKCLPKNAKSLPDTLHFILPQIFVTFLNILICYLSESKATKTGLTIVGGFFVITSLILIMSEIYS